MMTGEGQNTMTSAWTFLRLESMYEARDQDNISSTSIQLMTTGTLLSWTLWMKNEIQVVKGNLSWTLKIKKKTKLYEKNFKLCEKKFQVVWEKNLSCMRKKFKLCEKKFKFCNLDHLGIAILANFSNLANSANFRYLSLSLTIFHYLLGNFRDLSLSHCYLLTIFH